jgi:hypothetical protein
MAKRKPIDSMEKEKLDEFLLSQLDEYVILPNETLLESMLANYVSAS